VQSGAVRKRVQIGAVRKRVAVCSSSNDGGLVRTEVVRPGLWADWIFEDWYVWTGVVLTGVV
jgi:hypothetical protein